MKYLGTYRMKDGSKITAEPAGIEFFRMVGHGRVFTCTLRELKDMIERGILTKEGN